MQLSGGDLATLSLLDADQGVCPNGHLCRLDDRVGYRRCPTCDFRGLALICWEMTIDRIGRGAKNGADPHVVEWARAFVADRLESV